MDNYIKSKGKKTRQGSSNNTKYGNKVSKKYYKKKLQKNITKKMKEPYHRWMVWLLQFQLKSGPEVGLGF